MKLKYTNILSIIVKVFIFLNLFQFINCEEAIDVNETKKDIESVKSKEYLIKVSIIIPTYNSVQFLNRTVTSALSQTLKEIEIIVIDDHSTDNTKELMERFESDKRLKFISLSENQGPGNARNIGLDLAKGEFIGFIDSDDLVTEDYFESLYELSEDKDIVIGVFVNSTNDTDEYVHHGKFKEVGYGCVGDTLWRKSFLDKYNIRFEKNNNLGEDLNFRTEVMSHKPRKIKSPDIGAYYIYKRRTGSLMNYDPNYIDGVTEKARLHLEEDDDNTLRNVVIGVISCLCVTGLVGIFTLQKIKKSKHSDSIRHNHTHSDESEVLIKSN